MNADTATEVLWVRAVETAAPASWSAADAAWASDQALRKAGSDAPGEAFVAQRARAVLQRLVLRAPSLAAPDRLGALRAGRGVWLATAVVAGLLAGVLADRIAADQRINLLAPPVWAVIVWNLLVYAALLWRRLAGSPSGVANGWLQGVGRRWQRSMAKSAAPADGAAAVWAAFVPDWSRLTAPLVAARATLCLHAAAAALAVGLLGGMYLRGLALDYRVGWQSTFLDAQTVQPLLRKLLAPATVLTGIQVPDVAGIQALQTVPGQPAEGAVGSSAAPWIHLYAAQLLLLVLLPRLALALCSAAQVRRLSQALALPLHEPYFKQLLAQQQGRQRSIGVWPYALLPDGALQPQLQTLFQRAFGADTRTRLAAPVAFGEEDDWQAVLPQGEQPVALFDMAATPEAENHGRFLQRLAAAGPVSMLIDEAAFKRRFSTERLQQRRQAWQALADSLGVMAVFVDLQGNDFAAPAEQLQGAG